MEMVEIEGEKYIKERKLFITTLVDGDPYDPKWSTVPCDASHTLEAAVELATKLFGNHASVREEIKLSKIKTIPIGRQS